MQKTMTEDDFEKALKELEKGNIPEGFQDIIIYTEDSLRELRKLFGALVTCVQKQAQILGMVRKLNEALEKRVRELTGRNGT